MSETPSEVQQAADEIWDAIAAQDFRECDARVLPRVGRAPRVGGRSPWGTIQTVDEMFEGAWNVTTASHGGIRLDHRREAMVPGNVETWLGRDREPGWYEEDQDWAVVAAVFWSESCWAVEWADVELTLRGGYDGRQWAALEAAGIVEG